MVHQVIRFEGPETFSTWEEEFMTEEKTLRSEGLMESPLIYTHSNEKTIAVDLQWKSIDSARNYLKRHKYFEKVSTEEKPTMEAIDTYISQEKLKKTSEMDRKRITREGMARLVDMGIILSTEKSKETTKSRYTPEETGIKNVETGKIYTYDEARKTIRKLPEDDKKKIFKSVSVKYFN